MKAFDWDAYAKALQLLAKAPGAAHSKRDEIVREAARRTAAADARMRAAVAQRELLEERLAQVESLAGRLSEQAGDGPRQAVKAPVPADVRESLAVLATFEELLGQVPPPPPPPVKPKNRWWIVVLGTLVVVVVLVWTIWRVGR
jgi:NAD(P)-dependent dehydrogenase (short-subunit alcohol dehydrogenase family)